MTFDILKSGKYRTVTACGLWALWCDNDRAYVAGLAPSPWCDQKRVRTKEN